MHASTKWFAPLLALFLLAASVTGCQALRELTALRHVEFMIDRVEDPELVGLELDRVRSYEDLSAQDALRVGRSLSAGEMPFDFTLVVGAENPEDNPVQARMVAMDWTLLLDEEETISGRLEEEVELPPGEPRDVPVPISLDLMDFFDRNAEALFDLALAVAGREGEPRRVELQATPTVDTAVGPIRYPNPIIIASQEVGN